MTHTNALGKVGSRRAPGSTGASDGVRVIALAVDGEVRLGVYQGEHLEIDVPLSARQALVLASDLLHAALVVAPDGAALPRDGDALLDDSAKVMLHGEDMRPNVGIASHRDQAVSSDSKGLPHMLNRFEQNLATVRQRRQVAVNCIRRVGVVISDPHDCASFVEAQRQIIRCLEYEEDRLRALLHRPRLPRVRVSPKAKARASGRVRVLDFGQFRDLILNGTLRSAAGPAFHVEASARQMAELGRTLKSLRHCL